MYITNLSNRSQFITKTKHFRSILNISFRTYQNLVNYDRELGSISKNLVVARTTGDGNCLYNSISISLFGNEYYALDLKLCAVFIFFEYENYFKRVLNNINPDLSFDFLIYQTCKLFEFQNNMQMMGLSVVSVDLFIVILFLIHI